MTIAQGVFKQLRSKIEALWGVAPGPLGAKDVRRVTADFTVTKDVYESKEIRTDQQDLDSRHGQRKAEGSIKSEMNPGDQADFFAAMVRKLYIAPATTTAIPVTVEAPVGDVMGALVRATGSFLADGFVIGSVVRATGLTAPGSNANNFVVLGVSDLKLTGEFLNGDPLVAQPGAAAGVVIAEVGKNTFVPKTGHVVPSFAFEQWYGDVNQSELFLGMRVVDANISLPATGMAEVEFKFMGKKMVTGVVPYYTNSVEAGTAPALAAVSGRIYVGGKRLILATSASINIKGNGSTEAVIGSNEAPEIFMGRVQVDGSFTVLFETAAERDAFLAELERSLVIVLSGSEAKDAAFTSIACPRIKNNSATKDDGEKGLVQTVAFKALRGIGTQQQTTIRIQESTLA